jgi:chain length determinant protein tyrosine kinase EpsG
MGANERVERPIGGVLVEAGRLRAEDADLIVRVQRERGLRFGETGLSLGLLTPHDIDFALARQFDYPYLQAGSSPVSMEVFAAYAPFSREAEALRALRAQLMVRWFDDGPGRSALAIVSAGRGEGRSYVAANLAVTFSQAGERTLLIDADMRTPRQHRLFGVDNRFGLSAVLALRSNGGSIQRIPGLPHLSLLPAGAIPPNPHELVMRPVFGDLLQQLGAHYDVILLDSPPVSEAADAQTLAARAGAALVVVRKHKSRAVQVRALREVIPEPSIVGAVLNDF